MTTKEQIIEMFRDAGYDFLTAAEEATECLTRFHGSNLKKMRFGVMAGKKCVRVFELTKRA